MINGTTSHHFHKKTEVFSLITLATVLTIANTFPFYAHQFTNTWLPNNQVGSTDIVTTTFALPAVYNGYSRYLALAGFQLKSAGSIAFTMFPGNQTSTSQDVTLYPFNGTVFYTLSFYVVFLKNNDWIWGFSGSFSFSSISIDDTLVPLTNWTFSQKLVRVAPTLILNSVDFQIYPFVVYYSSAINNLTRSVPIILNISDWNISLDYTQIQLYFNRNYPDCQLVSNVALTVFVINTTQLSGIAVPHYLYTIASGAFSLGSIFISNQFGGYDGNCLIGLSMMQTYLTPSLNENITLLYNSTVAPIWIDSNNNVISYGVAICFHSCPDGQFYQGFTAQCQTCYNGTCVDCSALVTNCLQCHQYTLNCMLCITGYALTVAATCSPCSIIYPLCYDCRNSSYCLQCKNSTYYLSNNTCVLCAASIINCQTCTNNTVCTACAPGYYPIGHPNQCLTCVQVLTNCVLCSNLTVCQSCITSYTWSSTLNHCAPCSQLFTGCSTCNQTSCTLCQSGFFLGNNQICECMVGYEYNGECVIPGCIFSINMSNGLLTCLECDSSEFFTDPINGHCKCLTGNLMTTTCSNIANCLAATFINGQIICLSCNISNGFKLTPENNTCVCIQYYALNNGVCQQICGNGVLITNNQSFCDDGNLINGDGCSSQCMVQVNYRCENGSISSPSVCYYIGGKMTLALESIQKTQAKNQAVFQFKVSPVIDNLAKINMSQYFSLNCDSKYSVANIQYSNGVITLTAQYTSNFEGVPCNASLSFDRNIIRSPTAKTSFITNSNNFPLIYSTNLGQVINFGFTFRIIAYAIIAVFILSLSHKMIGAQLLVCCQMVYLSNCFYKIPSFEFSQVSNFSIITGYWSIFYSNTYKQLLQPFTSRVQLSPYFMDSNLIVVSELVIVLFCCAIFKLIQCWKLGYNINCGDQSSKVGQGNIQIKINDIKLKNRFVFKTPVILYKCLIFPFVAGFLVVLSISSLIHSSRLTQSNQSHFSTELNSFMHLFTLTILSMVFGLEFFGRSFVQNQNYAQYRDLIGESDAKNWYIPVYLIKQVMILLIIQFGIVMCTISYFLPVLLLMQIGYFFILIYFVPYITKINKVGVIFCTLTEFYSLLLPAVAGLMDISSQVFSLLIIVLFCLIVTSIILAIIRVGYAYKIIIIQCLKSNLKQENHQKSMRQPQQNYFWKEPSISQQIKIKNQKQGVLHRNQKVQKLGSKYNYSLIRNILNPNDIQQNSQNQVKPKYPLQSHNKCEDEVLKKQKKRLKQSLLTLKSKNAKK